MVWESDDEPVVSWLDLVREVERNEEERRKRKEVGRRRREQTDGSELKWKSKIRNVQGTQTKSKRNSSSFVYITIVRTF